MLILLFATKDPWIVKNFFETSISINNLQSPLLLSGITNCGPEVLIPDSHKTTGINGVDLIVYITTNLNPNVDYIAYSGACVLDSGNLNQVLAGRIVINVPNYKTIDFDKASMYSVIVHEMLHILGFSNGLFPYWKNAQGSPYAAGNQTVVASPSNITKTFLITPNVLQAVRDSSGCPTLIGLALEEQGPVGITNSHIDEFFHYGDILNTNVYGDPIFSLYCVAILRDTNHYNVDSSMGQPPIWNKNVGCEMVSKRCIKNEASTTLNKYCTDSSYGCDYYRTYKSICNTWRYNYILPLAYQYFKDTTFGGSDIYMDYCPFQKPTSNGSCYGSSQATSIVVRYGEIIGADSRCFVGNLVISPYTEEAWNSRCYKVLSCSPQGTMIQIGDSFVLCPVAGGQITVPGFNGYLICPSNAELCGDKPCWHGCYGRGKCISGKCICNNGYSGDDCSIECHSSCSSCTGPNYKQCIICSDPTKIPTGPACACRPNYLTLANGNCQLIVSCDRLCSNCALTTILPNLLNCNQCATNSTASNGFCQCNTGYLFKENTCPECMSGYYLNGTNCTQCPFPCYICSSPNICTACINGYNLINNRCINTIGCANADSSGYCLQCNPGYYISQGKCIQCTSPCNNCTSNTVCTSCLGSYKLNGTTCVIPDKCKTSDTINYVCTECSPGYYLSLGKCPKCTAPCFNCSNANCCNSCMGNYTLTIDKQCVCPVGCKSCDGVNFKCIECDAGYYFNAGTCVKCTEPCATCNATGCLSCLGAYNLTGRTCSCSSSCSYCNLKTWMCSLCKDGFYLNVGNCLPCLYPCSSCKVSNVCTSCIVPFVLDTQNQCVCPNNCLECDSTGCIRCLDGFYKSGPNCVQCIPPCKNCLGNATNCTSCLGQYVIANNTCKCPSCCTCDINTFFCATAKDGYFLSRMGCSPCSQPCATCQDSSLKCTKCMGSLVLTGTQCTLPLGCIKVNTTTWNCIMCDNNYYLNGDNTCTSCTAPCKACVSSYTQCTSCMGTYYLENNQCKCPLNCESCGINPYVCKSCIAGYIAVSGVCIKCDPTCKTCSGYPSNCQSCFGTYVLVNGQCNCPVNCKVCDTTNYLCTTCIDSFYQSSGLCYPCASQCKTCSTSALTCTSCYGNYTLASGNCVCPSNCKICDSIKYTCLQCNDNYALTKGVCAACILPCINCIDTTTSCTACKGKLILTGLSCLCPSNCMTCDTGPNYFCTKCSDGLFLTSAGECQACASGCKKCATSATICTECNGVFVISGTSCVCPTNCATCDSATSKCLACKNGSYYSNSNCFLCSPSCKTCSSSELTCTSCNGIFELINNQCACPSYCASCDINGVCTKCNDGWLMVNNVCTKCLAPCKTCELNTNNCRSCLGAHYYSIANNVGTCTCPKSCIICDQLSWLCTKCTNEFYYKNGFCFPCVSPCKTCTSDTTCLSCISNLELDTTTGKCNCPSNCAKCDSIKLTCAICKDGFFLNNGVCFPCEASCKTCTSNALKCTSCYKDFELNAKNQCCSIGCADCFLGTKCSECADKYYFSGDKCSPCMEPCVSCTSETFCKDCIGIYVVDDATGTCNCPLPCLECDTAGNCIECQSEYFLSAGKCEACLSPCKTCTSRDACLSCIDYRGMSISGCCTACPEKCITCDNIQNTCSSCVSPAVLVDGKC